MADVGSYGDIDFYCRTADKGNEILSFHSLTRSSRASFSEHERNGNKAYLEFNAIGLDEISMIIVADARYGIKPLEVEKRLFEKMSKGEAEIFVVGGKAVGDNPFVITSITETYKLIHTDGRPIKIEFQVTLKEYANKTVSSVKPKTDKRPIDTEASPKEKTNSTYVVKPGDCLWAIAKMYYGENGGPQYTKIFNSNRDKIQNPDVILPGWVLTIPN